jgi:exodeoxyribonuclease V alpha subunit
MWTPDADLQRQGARLLPVLPEPWAAALAGRSPGLDLLPLAEGLASFLPDPGRGPDLERTVLLLLLLLLAQAEGHVGLPLETGPDSLLAGYAAAFRADPVELAALARSQALAPLRGAPGSGRPLILDQDALYAQRLHQAETGLAEAVRIRLRQPAHTLPEPDPAVLEGPDPLNPDQALALRRALAAPLTLVTGGPGTGKTSIVVAILRQARRQGLPLAAMALAAPTGKAANRMAESMQAALSRLPAADPMDAELQTGGPVPATLHRLLGYQGGGGFRHGADQPLPAELVIVDESSMVDLVLMERLLRSVRPGARLVLLGDAQQLPSVEPGSVFQDLAAALPERVVRLQHSYRMDHPEGRPVLQAARKLALELPGDLFQAPDPLYPGALGEPLPGVSFLDGGHDLVRRFLLDWFHREVERIGEPEPFLLPIQHTHLQEDGRWPSGEAARLRHLFGHYRTARILCPLREGAGPRRAEGINALLHREASRVRDRGLARTLAFSLGEPVMVTRNDYARGLFNGDQGIVLKVARDGGPARLEVVFQTPEGLRAFAVAPLLQSLELAYALTVHKAQGSEYDRVAIVLPEEDGPFLTREILYTALTRARSRVTILGSEAAIRAAAARSQRRYSGLPGRLVLFPQESP